MCSKKPVTVIVCNVLACGCTGHLIICVFHAILGEGPSFVTDLEGPSIIPVLY